MMLPNIIMPVSLPRLFIPSLAVLLMMLFLNTTGFAQVKSDRYRQFMQKDSVLLLQKRNVLKTDFLGLLIGRYNITLERMSLRAPRSLVVTLEYANFLYDDFKFEGTSIMPGLRYYLTKSRQPPAGYYGQPFFIYSTYQVVDTQTTAAARVKQLGGGVQLGRQWVIADKFTIDFFIGGMYVESSIAGSIKQDAIRSFQIITGVNGGFRF